MLRITRKTNGQVVFTVSGQLTAENVSEMEALIAAEGKGTRVLDVATRPFLFRITEEGRAFLLQEGTDQRYGARHLKRAIERHVVYPIARLLATGQVREGDVLVIDRRPSEKVLAFLQEPDRRASDSSIFVGRHFGEPTQQVLEGT
jgi:hypothetical protein